MLDNPIILQAEDGIPGGTNSAGSLVRDIANPEVNGNRENFGGDGYIDFGNTAGDSFSYTFEDADGGARLLHVRYASNGNRPLDVVVNGTSVVADPVTATPFVDTDPDGTGGLEGFDNWQVVTFEITTIAGQNSVDLVIPTNANAPNVDAIAISNTGETVEFPITDITADVGGDLTATPVSYTVGLAEGSVEVTVTGVDDDITGLEVSIDGGTTFAPATLGVVTGGEATVSVDLSAITDPGTADVVLRVSDVAANTATAEIALSLVDQTVVAEIQAETFGVVFDADGDTAEASNQPGFTGSGFLDMGGESGDQVSFDVTAPADGTYTLAFRYANGGGDGNARPMALDVNASGTPVNLPFENTGSFEVWSVQTAEVLLNEGVNTITLANTINNGPNIDRVAILSDVPVTDAPPTALDGNETGVEDDAQIVVDIADLIADAEDDPDEPAITAAEVDPAEGTVSFAGTELTFIPALNFNGAAIITYTVEDSAGQPATGTVTVDVAAVNDAPTLTGSLTTAPAPISSATGGFVSLEGLVAADVDGTTPSLILGNPEDLPFGINLVDGQIAVAAETAPGTYNVEINAFDGALPSETVTVTVTVEAPVVEGFETILIEGEDFTIITPQPGSVSLDRTRDGNQEQPGENSDGSPNTPTGNNNTGLPNFDKFGLRPGYSGDGYLDINGTDSGPQIETTFEAPAGTYDIVVRLASNSNREIAVIVDGQSLPITDTNTTQFYLWETRTVSVTLDTDGTHTLAISQTNNNAPNIDAVAIAETGTPVDFDAPEIDASGLSVVENMTDTGAVPVVDFDGNTLTYEITGGADDALFTIDAATGVLSFIEAPDFEAPDSSDSTNIYQVQVTAEDETGDATVRTLSVTVTDVNEAPEITSDAALSIPENQTAVGIVTAFDDDEDTVTFSVTGGADQDLFEIDPDSGALSFKAAPDFEADESAGGNNDYAVEVTASDGNGGIDVQALTVSVTDVEPEFPQPVIDPIILQSETLPLNGATMSQVTQTDGGPFGLNEGYSGFGYTDFGTVAGEGVTANFDVTEAGLYDLTIRFAVSGSRPLDLTVGGVAEEVDFSGSSFTSYQTVTRTVALEVGDNPVSLTIPVGADTGPNIDALALTSVGEAPDFPPANSQPEFEALTPEITVEENVAGVIGDFGATDVDGDTPSYVLSGPDGDKFTINDDGELSFKAAPDFEFAGDEDEDNIYDLTVSANDGKAPPVEQAVTVTVTDDQSEVVPPSDITLAPLAFDENVLGASVATVTVVGGTGPYAAADLSLVGVDAPQFRLVDGVTGIELALATDVSLDTEAAAQPSIVVSFDGSVSSEPFLPVPGNVDEGATIELSAVDVLENVEGAVVATVAVTDPDTTWTIETLTLGGPDAGKFELADNGGVIELKLKAGESLDFEAAPVSVTVLAGTDASSPFSPSVQDEEEQEPVLVTFNIEDLEGYSNQDQPGTGAATVEAGNAGLTLAGNLWKRAPLPENYTITEKTLLKLQVQVNSGAVLPEIAGIGFDSDDSVFDSATGVVYEILGSQSPVGRAFVNLRNTPAVNDLGNGLYEVTIDLSDKAGEVIDSLVFVHDHDRAPDGYASTTFRNVILEEFTEGEANRAPVEVGGGIPDFSVDEGGPIEVDMPFIDPDGDALTYNFDVTDDQGAPIEAPGLGIVDGVLSGSVPDVPGVYTVTLTASDGNLTTTSEFVLTVIDVNDAPVAADPALEPYFFDAGTPIDVISIEEFRTFFTDADDDIQDLVLSFENVPPGLTVTEVEGELLLEGTPTVGGNYDVVVRATDPDGASDFFTLSFQIESLEIGDVVVVEAEDFTGLPDADGFFATGQGGQASGGQIIRTNLNAQENVVTTDLTQNGLLEGWYTVAMTRYDETDGSATFSLAVGDVQLADEEAFDAGGTFDFPEFNRGTGGQAGNIKTVVFDAPVFVTAGTILTLSGNADAELLRTDKFIFTRIDAPNEAPTALAIDNDTVAENADGAVVGALSASDPDGDDAALVFSVDPSSDFEILGGQLKLKSGVALDFEALQSVDVEVTATDALGGSTTATLTLTVTDVDEAPSAPVLDTAAVDENSDGGVVGVLTSDDPEGTAVTFTVSDSRFEVLGDGTLKLKPGEALDHETEETVSLDVTATDETGQVTTETLVVDVNDANDAPTLANPAALADVNVDNGAGASIDLSVLGATDEDEGVIPGYAISSADPLPAGFEISGDQLIVPTDAPAGTYEIEVFATDGDLQSESVSVTVTVGDPAPFAPITIQAEDEVLAELIVLDDDANTNDTTIRDPENPESNPSLENGLRPDFSGTGYLDFGDTAGDAVAFTVDVPVGGDYDLNIRYASQGEPRPLDLSVNGTAQGALDFTDTDPDGDGDIEGFDNWEFLTQTVTLTPGSNTITLAIPGGATTGPNIDRIEITEAGTGPIPDPDISADEDGNLAAASDSNTVAVSDLASVEIRLTGVDADIDAYEVSIDGGTSFAPATAVDDGDDKLITVDLTGSAAGTTVDVQLRLTDDAGNTVTTTASVDVVEDEVQPFSVTIQLETRVSDVPGEDNSPANIEIDDDTAGGNNNQNLTQIRDPLNIESVTAERPDGIWDGFNGTGYLDMGMNGGDAFTFEIDAPSAGSYTVAFRYANGGAADRPMDLIVNGQTVRIAFPTTTEWNTWEEGTAEVTLTAGVNTLRLEIPADVTTFTGPNLDQVTVSNSVVVDDSADEDGNLVLTAAASVELADSDMVEFTLTGVDADIETFEVSIDGGAFTEVTPAGGVVSLDLSSVGAGNTVDVLFRLTDDAGNTVDRTASVAVVADPVEAFDLTLQLENRDGSILIDDDTGDGEGDLASTQFRDLDNIEGIVEGRDDGLWNGYTGTGYMDMGGDIGDAFEFDVDVPSAGTYSFTFRYVQAGGTTPERPMVLSVDGAPAVTIPFASTGTGSAGWTNWTEVTVEVDLESGPNTIRMENTIANGPNLDSVNIFREGDVVDPGVEPGPRDTIRINFQDGDAPKADGYLVGNFTDFGLQSNGLTYGFVTEASAVDADGTTNTPAGTGYPAIAINERTAGEFADYDPRLQGYAHFDLRTTYPAGEGNRVGWEIELANGWYEVTVSVGDTGGPNDSNNRLFVEGNLATAWVPTDEFKSQLVTTLANVQDGNLTLSAQGGEVTEMQYLEIRELPDLTPDDGNEAPVDYASFQNARAVSGVGEAEVTTELDPGDGIRPEGIDPASDIFLDVNIVEGRGGVLLESLNDGSVKLYETLTGIEVPTNINTTGGFDSLTVSPLGGLKENTSYTLLIDGFQDRGPIANDGAATREFQKYSTSFVTGEAAEVVDRDVAFTDNVELNGAADGAFGFTSVEMSPDQSQLYVVTISGQIKRWDVNPDGSLDKATEETFTPLGDFVIPGADPGEDRRGFIGVTFDPEDPNTIWVTDNAPIPLTGRDNAVPDFSGRISKIELGADGSLENATITPYITGLPRSNGDHVTNSLEFRANPNAGVDGAPNFLLYLIQGSNSAMGEADSAWGFRPERLLNAAVMEIDHTRQDVPAGGFDVSTEPLPGNGLNRRFADNDGDLKNGGILIENAQDASLNGKFLHFAENGVATVREGADSGSAVFREYYDPFADDAVLNIFATGQRNAYDLVWHSNGFLYVPTNGSAGGGVSPDDPDSPGNQETSHPTQNDYLFRVVEDGYYGHPNPVRNEFILNGGNPTNGSDPNETGGYGFLVDPDPNYDLEGSYSLGKNRSPNGATEYTSSIFGNSLQGAVLFTEYSGGDDVRVVLLGADGTPVEDFVLQDPDGATITYTDPLDIVEGANGQLYLITLNRGNGQSQLVRLDPAPGGVVGDNTADEGNNLSLTVVDATDPAAVVFLVNGLDDDIETLEISFAGTTQTVVPNAQNQFTVNMSGETGPVTVTLTVQDEVPNTATDSVTFTPGETPEPQDFYDGLEFDLLPTAESTDYFSNSDPDANGGGDGAGYVDFGGGIGDKVSLDVTVAVDGIYDIVLRMANGSGNPRPIDVKLGDQVVSIADTGTDSFATWQDFLVQLTLDAGVNTIVFAQTTGAGGPNIDSATVTLDTPLGVPNDGTEVVAGVTFIKYEAENAQLDGPVIDDEDRGQSGGQFVDFDGTTDQSITWTVSVAETGNYGIDFLYALQTTKEARPAELFINGTSLGNLPFVPNSVGDESDWGPQSAEVTLTAGVNTIAITAPNANGANIDYLRVTQAPLDDFVPNYAAISDDGRIELEATDQTTRTVDDSTVEFYFTVDADDLYALDLAANAGAPDGSGLTVFLTADGGLPVEIDDSGFPGEGDAGETTAYVELQAGVNYKLTVVSDQPGASALDYLDVRTAPGNENADIEVQSLDPAFFENRLHFSWVENSDGRDFKESAQFEITNTGTEALEILEVEISEFYSVISPAGLEGTSIAAGDTIVVTVEFDGSTGGPDGFAARASNVNGVYEGLLTLRTNDADSPIASLDLAAFWQPAQEGGNEPNVNEVWQVLGFGNEIAGLPFSGGGESSVLDFDDLYLPAPGQEGIEELSPYWRLADGVTEARATIVAAYNSSGSAALAIHNPGNTGQQVGLSAWGPGSQSQTLFPLESGGGFATELFGNSDIPNGWLGNELFGIKMANLSTDPTLNPSGNGTPSQNALNNAYGAGTYTVTGTGAGAVVTDADGNVVEDGYTVRMFQALDADGNAIENVFLGMMDYTGINYDYNDNMFIFEGITPVGNGGVLTISGLDEAAADDRLVFTNIDNPNNGGGIGGQTFRNVAEITLTNDGIGAVNITGFSLAGVDQSDFQVTGSVGSLAVGASTTVTVTFVGSDPADDNAAELRNATLTVESDGFDGDKVIQLAGLAQFQSEGGEEPTVAQVVEAFGYSTDMAQGQLANGGQVETIGDEVLLPYLQRLDGSQPVEVIQIAAFLQQTNVARLNIHDLESSAATELFAQDDQEGQTVSPKGLATGAGNTGSVAAASIERDEPFGLYISVDGRPTFASWTDPEANRIDPDFGQLVGANQGHLIRFFQAKDGNGDVIEGTFIGIQDYPGAGNYDYNDHMFVIKNVQAYDLTGADDANSDGINDALQNDDDNDGTVNFFDDDFTPPVGPQAAFNPAATPWEVDGDGLTLMANLFDTGGQDVAYNDSTVESLGDTTVRPGEAVDISNGTGAIGYTVGGEWVEYTINVAVAGDYELIFNSSSPIDGRLLTATFATGGSVYETVTADVANTGAYTTYADTAPVTVSLNAGVQVMRVNFDNNQQDLMSFTLTPEDPPEPLQSPFPGPDAPVLAETLTVEAENFDAGGQGISWNDNPGRDGASALRSDTDVELVGAENDIGFILAGEWVEYTIDVAQAGTYALSLNAKTPIADNSITVSIEDGPALATFALPDANGAGDNSFGGTAFAETGPQLVDLEAGEQTLRLTFDGVPATNGYVLDFRSFTLTAQEPVDVNQAPTTTGIAGQTATEGESFTLNVSGAFDDPDGDPLTFTASGLPSGLILNGTTGEISGTLPQVTSDTDFTVIVTASDGELDEDAEFVLTVDDVPDPVDPDQTPFPGPIAPTFTDGALTIDASNYDDGGQGIAYNDAPGLEGGSNDGGRTGSDVEQTPLGDVGWIGEGEWLEYTIEVDEAGAYNLELQLATNGGAGRTATVDFYQLGSDTPYASSGPVANPVTGGWTSFQPRTAEGIDLQAGTQIVRVTFNGGSQDFREFTLELEETVDPNQQPILEAALPAFSVDEDDTLLLDVSAAFSDPDGDDLIFSADGLPAGLSISDDGLITGTAPLVNADTVSSVTVTATDTGGLSVASSFDLTVADVPPVANDPIGEAGLVSVAQTDGATWFQVNFAVALDNPSVVMGPMTLNDSQPATIRVQNITSEGFEFQVDEWNYLDGSHAEETISWLAIEEGVHTLESGQVVAAGSGFAAGSASSISFGTSFGSAPVVLGQVASAVQSQAVADRIKSVSSTGFSVALDREEAFNGTLHGSEEFSWIAIGKGGSAADGLLVGATGTSVGQNAFAIDFGGSFDTDQFAFVADMQTENGTDPSMVRLASALTTTGTSVFIQEEQSGDTEVQHSGKEDVGYVAIELGSIFDQDLIV